MYFGNKPFTIADSESGKGDFVLPVSFSRGTLSEGDFVRFPVREPYVRVTCPGMAVRRRFTARDRLTACPSLVTQHTYRYYR